MCQIKRAELERGGCVLEITHDIKGKVRKQKQNVNWLNSLLGAGKAMLS